MYKSPLGKWIKIGTEEFDPLELAGSDEYGVRLLEEWLTILFLISVANELDDILYQLIKKSSRQRGRASLGGYTVKLVKKSNIYTMSVNPPPRDARKKINVFELLDKGNDPGDGYITPKRFNFLGFRPRLINMTVSSVQRNAFDPVSVRQGVAASEKIHRLAVSPYEGRELYRKIVLSSTKKEQESIKSLIKLMENKTLIQVDTELRRAFRSRFKTRWYSTMPKYKRSHGRAWIGLNGLAYLENAKIQAGYIRND